MKNNNKYLQFPGSLNVRSDTVVIGVDFGTSCSKVVIQNVPANQAFAVPFGPYGHPENPYLTPTRPYFNKEGKFRLSLSAQGEFKPIKSTLMDNSAPTLHFDGRRETPTSIDILAISYIGNILKYARRWYIEECRSAFGDTKIEWQFNLGIASTGRQEREKKPLFEKIATVAWQLSLLPEIQLNNALEAWNDMRPIDPEIDGISADGINVMPEVAAQVAGYARSDMRSNGLHLLVDIGAGTMDVVGFSLNKPDDTNRLCIYSGNVKWLGAYEFFQFRVSWIKEKLGVNKLKAMDYQDPMMPIPNNESDYLPRGAEVKTLEQIDREFMDKCRKHFQETIVSLKRKRDPHSKRWKEGVPVFLCGGGGELAIYWNVLNHSSEWLVKNGNEGLRQISLPIPTNLVMDRVKSSEFHRLSVAYGLSFPAYEIGDVLPPDEIPDLPPRPPRDGGGNFIDKDHM